MRTQAEIIDVLVGFAVGHRWEGVRDRVQALARIHVIDSIAAMLAGVASDHVQALGSTLFQVNESLRLCSIGEHGKNPAHAAYAYALSGRVLNYDDVQTTEHSTYGLLTNPSVPVLAAALAVGQAKHVSGEALLDAYLVGVETAARLAAGTEPMNLANRLAATTTFGGVGALIAAAKLLGLDSKRARAAFDLWQILVPLAPLDYESPTNIAYRDAHSVRMAVEAALQAENHLRPDPTFFGPLSMVTPNAIASLGRRLGKPYCILEPGFAIRIYPSNPLTHPAIDAALAIVNVHGIQPADIERIEVGMTRIMMDRLSTEPPANIADLGHSLPYAIALAVCKGAVEPGDFRGLPSDPTLIEMMHRVRRVVDRELDDLGYERARSWVRVNLRSGRAIALKLEVAKGSPQKPLSEVELSHKFFQCALHSIDEHQAEQLLNRLWVLETLDDVAHLFDAEPGLSGDAHGIALPEFGIPGDKLVHSQRAGT